MAFRRLDRARMTVSAGGTGAITLGSAVTGFRTFAAAGMANADTFRYLIVDGTAWELGLGTYTSSGTSFTRVRSSSSTGADLDVTTAAEVSIIFAAADADAFASLTGTETLSGKTLVDPVITGAIKEDIFTITDAAAFEIDPSNGSIQFITLGASRTPAATNFQDGESVTLRIADGTAFTITWTTVGVVWKGGSAPTLATTGYTEVHLEKSGGVIRGVHVGDFAS